MGSSTMLLSVLTALLFNVPFALAVHQDGPEPRWILLYLTFLLFNASLYLRHLLPGLSRGLAYAAAALAAFMSALYFYGFAPALPLPFAVAVWIGLAVAAYFVYLLIVLHLEDDDDAGRGSSAQQAQIIRLPV